MDYAKSFSFFLDDPRWKEKAAWGSGLAILSVWTSFILIGALGFFILAGYGVRLLQNVRDGEEYPLPEWDDWGGDFIRGAKLAVAAIVWALPLLLLSVPTILGWAIADSEGFGSVFGVFLGLCSTCLVIVYALVLALAAPGYTIAYAKDERISSALQFTDIWRWSRANLSPVVVTILLVIVAQMAVSLVAGIVGGILCGVGVLVTVPVGVLAMTAFSNHLYGQLDLNYSYGQASAFAYAGSAVETGSDIEPDAGDAPAEPAESESDEISLVDSIDAQGDDETTA